jgi:NAD(P)-dependent dehydrogenase (short-subunit alcohol dehydrogenase family)
MSTALVTGVVDTHCAGYAAARRLAAAGHHVIVAAPQRADAELAAAQLRAEGIAASPLRLDVTNVECFLVIVQELRTRFGRLAEVVDGGDLAAAPELAAALRGLLEEEPMTAA